MSETVRTKPFRLDYDDAARIHLARIRPQLLTFLTPIFLASFFALVGWLGVAWYIALAVLLIGAGLGFMAQPIRLRRTLQRPQYEAAFAERTVEISPTSVHQFDNAGIDSTFPLQNVLFVRVIRNHYALALTPAQYILIPRSAFANEEDERRFQGYVRKAVSQVSGF